MLGMDRARARTGSLHTLVLFVLVNGVIGFGRVSLDAPRAELLDEMRELFDAHASITFALCCLQETIKEVGLECAEERSELVLVNEPILTLVLGVSR